MKIKLLKKRLRVNGEYFPCHYSPSCNNRNNVATIYLSTYKRLPKEVYEFFNVQNETDIMTDYFEKDRIRISPEHELFSQVEELAKGRL